MRSRRAQGRLLRAEARYQTFLASGKVRRRKAKYILAVETIQRRFSTRPILRPELEDKLWERESKLLAENLRWSHSRPAARVAEVKDYVEHKMKVAFFSALGR